MGIDGISNTFIKLYKDILIPPITYLCNLSFDSGLFPDLFKKSVITPIHKSGDTKCVNNYRPISVLPALSKILERLLNNRLMKYLELNNLLSSQQFGFRAGKSTDMAVGSLVEHLVRHLNKKQKALAIFLDLAKAFDTVSIPHLLLKLEAFGIRGTQLNLFSDYLTNRTQCVRINDNVSDELSITFGVPQGSVLGPTLFLIYINNLCSLHLHNGTVFTFADDTALLFASDSWVEVFQDAQNGFNIVFEWLRANVLTLNVDKTKYITFTIRPQDQPHLQNLNILAHRCNINSLTCNSCPELKNVEQIKYLGIILDYKLSFHQHIHSLTSRLRKLIFIFKNLRSVADNNILKMVYFATTQSILSYCVASWGGAPKTVLLKLERAQRAIIKVSLSLPYTYPTKDLYQRFQVLTVRQLFIRDIILKQHLLLPYSTQSTQQRRNYNVCRLPDFKSTFARRFLCYLGGFLYNRVNKLIGIYPLTKKECKVKITKWIITLDYNSTEALLAPVS